MWWLEIELGSRAREEGTGWFGTSHPFCRASLLPGVVSEAGIWTQLCLPCRFRQQEQWLGLVSPSPHSPQCKQFPSSFVMWELLWRLRPSCLAACCWDAVFNLFSVWIGFQIGLGNWTPLFVPQTGITSELQAEAEHGVQGQVLIFQDLGWVWEGEGTFGEPREMMSITKN